MKKTKIYRVYRWDKTPNEGYYDFYDVKSRAMAVKLSQRLNQLWNRLNKKKNVYVWA